MATRRPPVHPGAILFHDFLEPMEVSQYRLAKECHLSPTHVGQIVRGARAVTAPVALALGKFFGTDAQWWMNMQAHYDLELARRSAPIAQRVARVRRIDRATYDLKPSEQMGVAERIMREDRKVLSKLAK